MIGPNHSLAVTQLREGYRRRQFAPTQVMREVLRRIAVAPQRQVWISRVAQELVMESAAALDAKSPEDLPLYGVPFAIKDNMDLAGLATTAGCPAYAYEPEVSATVVQKLIAAGAIPIGKTNLDQFATGLVGVRSPYGACRNSIDERYIAGGSSSGSAVAVASGLVSFALGTDTAGSGRVPAAFNNIVGLKPSCGLLSTRGVVPACRSLDCVSIFALTTDDAAAVLEVAQGFDVDDPYSRQLPSVDIAGSKLRVGVPRPSQLAFFGDTEYAHLFAAACERIAQLGWQVQEIDFEPFLQTARLLYDGPWVAERYAAIADFIERQAQAMHPITRQIIAAGNAPRAVDAFRAQYRLKELQRRSSAAWHSVDVLMTPTAGTIYAIRAVESDPIRLNSNLGYYTNFVNLLDLTAVAVPAGFRADGMPFGVTLIGPAGADAALLRQADALHRSSVTTAGASQNSLPAPTQIGLSPQADSIDVVVCGAHMEGLPLNHQLRDRNATLRQRTSTAACYRFYALPGGPPQRPGLVRVADGGCAIEVEVWSVPSAQFGSFVAGIPAPLGIGKIELSDGTQACGFLCEAWAIEGARDISRLGGWRAYLAEGA